MFGVGAAAGSVLGAASGDGLGAAETNGEGASTESVGTDGASEGSGSVSFAVQPASRRRPAKNNKNLKNLFVCFMYVSPFLSRTLPFLLSGKTFQSLVNFI